MLSEIVIKQLSTKKKSNIVDIVKLNGKKKKVRDNDATVFIYYIHLL